MKRAIAVVSGILMAAAVFGWLFSCAGGGGGLSGDITLNVGSGGQDIALTANETLSVAFTVQYDVQKFGGPFGSVSLNLQDNLSGLSFTPQAEPLGLPGQAVPLQTLAATMWLRIGLSEAIETVCSDGELYGPFSLMIDGQNQPESFSPPSAEATTTTMNIINTGAYSLCVQVLVPVSAVADLNRVGFGITRCDEPPADIAGTWTGTYSCSSNCGDDAGDVTMVIVQDSQDPSIASYTDEGGATYEGTVCGNRFSFRGGRAGLYDESGTFIMDPGGGTASKSSTYRVLPTGTCRGTCADTLTRTN